METLADFGTVSYFALEVFTTGIFKAWLSLGDSVAAAQLSACLLVFVALVIALERASRGRAAYHEMAPRKSVPSQRLGRGAGALALLACAVPVVFGFLLPAALLGYRD
jgi:iron(III) transport system permease protein